MIQRSSADHELRVPHLLRTPATLYKTICYIEQEIINAVGNINGIGTTYGEEDASQSVMCYLFIWDRYRMIAKDFILQSSSLPKDAIWIEVHERMARWYVLMDHLMIMQPDMPNRM